MFRTEHKIGTRRWTIQATLPGFATRRSVRNLAKAPPCNSISKQRPSPCLKIGVGLRRPVAVSILCSVRNIELQPRRCTVQAALPGLATRGPVRIMAKVPPCNSISKHGPCPCLKIGLGSRRPLAVAILCSVRNIKLQPRRWTVQAALPGFPTRISVRNMENGPPCYSISQPRGG